MNFLKLYSIIENIHPVIEESKQSIKNLGYPDVVIDYFQDRYGKYAPLIARWFREYHAPQTKNNTPEQNKGWFDQQFWKSSLSRRGDLGYATIVDFYNGAKKSLDAYNKVRKENDFDAKSEDTYDPHMDSKAWKDYLYEQLDTDLVFRGSLLAAFKKGQITDLSPFKKLSYYAAIEKFNTKKIFEDSEPVITLQDGSKWINAGPRCELIGDIMKNCGSAGVMSTDPDKTIMTLFDKNNNGHLIATYSPNEKRISGVQGKGSSKPKDEYYHYLPPLLKQLGANFDYGKSDSKYYALAYLYGQNNVNRIGEIQPYNEYFKIDENGEISLTNGYTIIPYNDIPGDIKTLLSSDLEEGLRKLFHYLVVNFIKSQGVGIKYI